MKICARASKRMCETRTSILTLPPNRCASRKAGANSRTMNSPSPRDRFASGVADTVEVVQAQEVVSSAEQDYIASLNAHNLAKASVARATGQAEKIMRDLLRSQ